MGLFKKAKERRKQRKEEIAKLNEARGELLATTAAEYMGGYGDKKAGTGFGLLRFYKNQIEFESSPTCSSDAFTITTDKISEINIEGKDDVSRRVTATRLIALGVFALALKKKTQEKESYITIELTDCQEVIFRNYISPMETKVMLTKATTHIRQCVAKTKDTL